MTRWKSLFSLIFLLLGMLVHANCQKIRPLSETWYRLPYADDTEVEMHLNNTLFFENHLGWDMKGQPFVGYPSPYVLVAAADGVVVRVIDSDNECGYWPGPDSLQCDNSIWIAHANGEYTGYYHIAFNSAMVDSGDVVQAGDPIAIEGDVGTTSSTNTLNRLKLGCEGVEDEGDTTYCGIHLHFAVSKFISLDTDTLVHPRICSMRDYGYVLLRDANIAADDNGSCDPLDCPPWVVNFGTWEDTINVMQATSFINSSAVIDNSVIGMQAEDNIVLTPGFHARSGSYFRAEIGTCNTGKPAASTVMANNSAASRRIGLGSETAKKSALDSLLLGEVMVPEMAAVIPQEFALSQNYPNPFNPITTIRYALKEDVFVFLRIYNMLGQQVRTLVNEFQPASYQEIQWDGRDDSGSVVSAGSYIYRLVAKRPGQALPVFTESLKIIHVK